MSVPSRGSAGGWQGEADSICSRLRRETGRADAEVALAVNSALEHFRDAHIRDFVMVLAERDARHHLRTWRSESTRTTAPAGLGTGRVAAGGRYGEGDR